MRAFVQNAQSLRLAFELDVSALPTEHVAEPIHSALGAHFSEHNFAFLSSSDHAASSLSPSSSSRSSPREWTLLQSGKGQRSSNLGALLTVTRTSVGTVTHHTLRKVVGQWPSFEEAGRPERFVIFISTIHNFDVCDELMFNPSSNNEDYCRTIVHAWN
jgi:hypothetical protein